MCAIETKRPCLHKALSWNTCSSFLGAHFSSSYKHEQTIRKKILNSKIIFEIIIKSDDRGHYRTHLTPVRNIHWQLAVVRGINSSSLEFGSNSGRLISIPLTVCTAANGWFRITLWGGIYFTTIIITIRIIRINSKLVLHFTLLLNRQQSRAINNRWASFALQCIGSSCSTSSTPTHNNNQSGGSPKLDNVIKLFPIKQMQSTWLAMTKRIINTSKYLLCPSFSKAPASTHAYL